jgi:hypothetical protein
MRCPCQWDQRFFGLTPEDKEALLLEPFFLLGYYFGMTWQDYYHLPVTYKRWLIERIQREIKKTNSNGNEAGTKGAHHNDPQTRAFQGKHREHVPARLRRFT